MLHCHGFKIRNFCFKLHLFFPHFAETFQFLIHRFNFGFLWISVAKHIGKLLILRFFLICQSQIVQGSLQHTKHLHFLILFFKLRIFRNPVFKNLIVCFQVLFALLLFLTDYSIILL